MADSIRQTLLREIQKLPEELIGEILDFTEYLLQKRTAEKKRHEEEPREKERGWQTLQGMAGSVEGPADWSEELEHYLYGTPKTGS